MFIADETGTGLAELILRTMFIADETGTGLAEIMSYERFRYYAALVTLTFPGHDHSLFHWSRQVGSSSTDLMSHTSTLVIQWVR